MDKRFEHETSEERHGRHGRMGRKMDLSKAQFALLEEAALYDEAPEWMRKHVVSGEINTRYARDTTLEILESRGLVERRRYHDAKEVGRRIAEDVQSAIAMLDSDEWAGALGVLEQLRGWFNKAVTHTYFITEAGLETVRTAWADAAS